MKLHLFFQEAPLFLILRLGRWSVSISQDVAGDANRNEENRKSEGIIAKIAKTDNFTDII